MGRITAPPSPPATSARGEEDVLQFGVVVERVRAQLAADARLLEPAKRRGHAHRRVRVDRYGPRLQGARDAHGAAGVRGPHRTRQPVDGVVGDAYRLGLVLERYDRRDGAEDLFSC